jgi:hypothetical protein
MWLEIEEVTSYEFEALKNAQVRPRSFARFLALQQ